MRPLAFPDSVGHANRDDRAAAAQQNMKMAFSLYEELLSQNLPPDHVVYNMLIGACGEAQDFAAAEGIFVEMREKVSYCLRAEAPAP
jgi:pentatricopeptide repeat protein